MSQQYRFTASTRMPLWRACAFLMVVFVLVLPAVFVRSAFADSAEPRPSVLIVDANLGDLPTLTQRWLGDEPKEIVQKDGLTLLSASNPAWWSAGTGKGDAPSTYVLGTDAKTNITTDSLTWALDSIRLDGAEARTFVIAMGTTGLRVREYVEDLAATKQSRRADVVGMCFCGTPHMGYGAQATYPELTLWEVLGEASDLSAGDIAAGSDYVDKLNKGSFPAIVKALNIVGEAGDLGFGISDGAGTHSDLSLTPSLTSQFATVQVAATISQEVGLSHMWMPFTSSIDYPDREVDANLAERMSAISSYASTEEVQAQVVGFYESWFTNGAPVSHNSSVLALDLSGSMLDMIEENTSKLDAAKRAAVEYLHAMQACTSLTQAPPMDVTVLGFNEGLEHVTSAYDDAACKAIESISAQAIAETNIGIALDEALTELYKAPTCAKKHILLLSDGASTRGKSNEEMMNTCVADAKRAGITVDVVGFGDVGESNAGFLKSVAEFTGGEYYEANDSYELKCDFLKTYYSSLGLDLVDEEVATGKKTTEALGTADARTSAFLMGVVADDAMPQVRLLCNGKQVDEDLYTVTTSAGLLSVQFDSPVTGEYTLELTGNKGRAHVFSVRQLGIPAPKHVGGEQKDWSLLMLIGAGILLVVSLAVVIVVSRRHG